MTTLFVTGYKNINREQWVAYNRKQSVYVHDFCRMALAFASAGHRLLVYVDQDVRKECEETFQGIGASQPDLVEFVDLSTVSTFLDKYLPVEQAIIDSAEYKATIPPSRKTNPEHVYAAYNLINHSKINMVADAAKANPSYDYYMWTDFGCKDYPSATLALNRCPPSKVVYALYTQLPFQRPDATQMLSSDTIYFMGSQFVVHKDAVEAYEALYEAMLLELHQRNISDDDQNVVLQLYYQDTSLFAPVYLGQWFSLLSRFLNT